MTDRLPPLELDEPEDKVCREPVWVDGIWKTTCGRTLVDGKCGLHWPVGLERKNRE